MRKMTVYECLVIVTMPNKHRSVQPVQITAIDSYSARVQLQALYGKDCLFSSPVPVTR
jgi:hypothetical protein